MNQIRSYFVLTALLFCFSFSQAQKCDPWIQQIYQQLYGRTATTEECNIRNYNGGNWNSYCELVGYVAAYNKNRAGDFLKGDPWIFQVYCELYGRMPNAWELNTANYNGGSWNNYQELKNYIQQYQNALKQLNANVLTGKVNGKPVAGLVIDGKLTAVSVISINGGQVVAPGGGNVIAPGGGNVIAVDPPRVVAPGGANVIAPGGGNLTVSSNMAGLNVSSGYQVQSAGTRTIKTSGKSSLVIH